LPRNCEQYCSASRKRRDTQEPGRKSAAIRAPHTDVLLVLDGAHVVFGNMLIIVLHFLDRRHRNVGLPPALSRLLLVLLLQDPDGLHVLSCRNGAISPVSLAIQQKHGWTTRTHGQNDATATRRETHIIFLRKAPEHVGPHVLVVAAPRHELAVVRHLQILLRLDDRHRLREVDRSLAETPPPMAALRHFAAQSKIRAFFFNGRAPKKAPSADGCVGTGRPAGTSAARLSHV
jgi:hypothetical protein